VFGAQSTETQDEFVASKDEESFVIFALGAFSQDEVRK
jgi:hypothetical protein